MSGLLLIGLLFILTGIILAVFLVVFVIRQIKPHAAPQPESRIIRTATVTAPITQSTALGSTVPEPPSGATVTVHPEIASNKTGQPTAGAKLYVRAQMTEAEGRFHDFLRNTIGNQFIIETKTPLKDLIKKYGWLERELYIMYRQGHIDFLILEPVSRQPVLAIELDDPSHDTPRGQDRDQRKDELFKRANLPLVRVRKGKLWGTDERKLIRQALRLEN